MSQKTLAAVLGTAGLILILAGPAFHFIPNQVGIFAALVCWLVAGLLSGLAKKPPEAPPPPPAY